VVSPCPTGKWDEEDEEVGALVFREEVLPALHEVAWL